MITTLLRRNDDDDGNVQFRFLYGRFPKLIKVSSSSSVYVSDYHMLEDRETKAEREKEIVNLRRDIREAEVYEEDRRRRGVS